MLKVHKTNCSETSVCISIINTACVTIGKPCIQLYMYIYNQYCVYNNIAGVTINYKYLHPYNLVSGVICVEDPHV